MNISTKGRYGLASMAYLAQNYFANTPISVISIAEKLNISKIYLEQVFSLLKRANLVISIKGAHGGYQLANAPDQINIYQVLFATEISLFEPIESTVNEKMPALDKALTICVFNQMDQTLKTVLEQITLSDIVDEAKKHKTNEELMYFI